MNKTITKFITSILLIMIIVNFIFPSFVHAYTISKNEPWHHFYITDEEERDILKDIGQTVMDNIKRSLNENIIDPYVRAQGITITEWDNLSFTDEEKNKINEELIEYFDDYVFDSETGVNTYYWGDLESRYTSNYIVRDYMKSFEFLDQVDELYAQIEEGKYLQTYIDNESITSDEFEPVVSVGTDRSGEPTDPLNGKFKTGILDGVLGILFYPTKLLFVVPAAITRVAINTIADQKDTTLQSIFFNEIDSININIFEANTVTSKKIAEFYKAFRNLAIVLSLAVLIYIGICMAINSTGEGKAKYKEMLVNWLVGFALIFVLSYIIYFVIKANEMLVNALVTDRISNDVMSQLASQIWAIPFTISFASITMYIGLLLMTFIFLITYIKRMVTVSFLIVISPLISVTYAIDKVDNNKSEILNTWLKEFLYNVLIQPFHCIIFSVFIGTAMNLIENGSDFGSMVFAIILTFCIFMGQKIVREIFGFSNSKSFYEKAVDFVLISKVYGGVKNTISNVQGIKGARNERAVRKQNKELGNIVGSEPVTGADMVKYRMMAEENRNAPNTAEKGESESQPANTEQSQTRKPKIDLRNRFMKNAPRRLKRATRFYGRKLKKYSGYNTINNIRRNRKKAKLSQTHLNKQDYAIALSEMYRQEAGQNMSNLDLAEEYRRISNEDISSLNADELSYRLRMESLKANFKINDDEILDAILNGSSENRRWRG